MNARLFAIIAALIIFISVINLIRKQKMTFKYSVLWLSICLAVLFFAVYEQALFTLSKWAGFELPSNFVFFFLLIFFSLSSLFLTIYINEQNTRSERLAQTTALLERKLADMDKKLTQLSTSNK